MPFVPEAARQPRYPSPDASGRLQSKKRNVATKVFGSFRRYAGYSPMRHWHRSVGLLGDPAVEDAIRRELNRLFPPDRVPVDISVIGGEANAFVTVRVTNFDHGINVTEKARPQEYGHDTLAAVIGTANRVIAELEHSGTFPKRTTYPRL